MKQKKKRNSRKLFKLSSDRRTRIAIRKMQNRFKVIQAFSSTILLSIATFILLIAYILI